MLAGDARKADWSIFTDSSTSSSTRRRATSTRSTSAARASTTSADVGTSHRSRASDGRSAAELRDAALAARHAGSDRRPALFPHRGELRLAARDNGDEPRRRADLPARGQCVRKHRSRRRHHRRARPRALGDTPWYTPTDLDIGGGRPPPGRACSASATASSGATCCSPTARWTTTRAATGSAELPLQRPGARRRLPLLRRPMTARPFHRFSLSGCSPSAASRAAGRSARQDSSSPRATENGVRAADFNVLMNALLVRAHDKVTRQKSRAGLRPSTS